MITEIAQIEIDPAQRSAFEAAVQSAEPHFRAAKGFRSFALTRSIEYPGRYRLLIGWDSVDDHMIGFRNSDGFQAWRALASPFFLLPPQIEHLEQVMPA
ncbi:antibiotic biosynthesis monooxygenase [Sphingobium sp. HBC34]|uniref:Antibiotic biosynthesis monooxygenase n=1 Tax=Sphingobium cyanobacteriorum TaxID=3063954 RepID=A0ABT8ZNN3_9SPHN|nr:antibiotic biosynthesis monooxygenase [Sphingobium sp. HBC34]MDO7836147.1 antibiotic biosynthesis monooxygenase [Sphingobium sp. HBC34]